MSKSPNTRERIVSEALRLFGERGFRGTTVGEIEAAAGLSPRSGGLYKHFRSKEDLLAAGIERHVGEIEAIRPVLDLMPLGDLRSELTLVARWALEELGAEQPLMRVVQKDGDRFPELVAEVHERIVRRGHREASKVMGRMFADAGVEGEEADALATVALGSLVGYRLEESMFGRTPGGVVQEQLVAAWVDVWLTFAEAKAGRKGDALAGRASETQPARESEVVR